MMKAIEFLKIPNTLTFDDIKGYSYQKESLSNAFKVPRWNPNFFSGAKKPCMAGLIFGPPGSSKTSLAKALAKECKMGIFYLKPENVIQFKMRTVEYLDMIFREAERCAPTMIVLDEAELLFSSRSAEDSLEENALKTRILYHLENLSFETEVVVICVTNHPYNLDVANYRRFQRRVHVPLPDDRTRVQLLQSILVNEPILASLNLRDTADGLEGYNADDIENICSAVLTAPYFQQIKGMNEQQVSHIIPVEVNSSNIKEGFAEAKRRIKPSVPGNYIQMLYNWNLNHGAY